MDQSNRRPGTSGTESDSEIVYFNGIDPETGQYAVPPTPIEDVARTVLANPGFEAYESLHGDRAVPFAPPYGLSLDNVAQVGWAIVFPEDTPAGRSRRADAPRRTPPRAGRGPVEGPRLQEGRTGPRLVSSPQDRHRQLRTRARAVLSHAGRAAHEYPVRVPVPARHRIRGRPPGVRLGRRLRAYARSVVEYETATAVKNAKEIVYWGTCHAGGPRHQPERHDLIEPLANGIDNPAAPTLKKPVHEQVGYGQKLFSSDDATKANLMATLNVRKAAGACCSPPRTGCGPRRERRTSSSSRVPCCARTGPGSAPCGPTVT